MKSISKYIDAFDVAAEVRMERQSHKGAFLLVEGETDASRLMQVVNEATCSFVICFGKSNVVGAIENLYDDGHQGVLGMVDADFARLENRPLPEHEGLIVSSLHDFDLEMVLTDALRRYLKETCESDKLDAWGGFSEVPLRLMEALRPLSILRFVNEKYQLKYSLERLEIDKFFDGAKIDHDKMVREISYGKFSSSAFRQKIERLVEEYSKPMFDLKQLTSGHDLCAALGVALRSKLGLRKLPQTWRSEVELHLRLAFSMVDLRTTETYSKIRNWEFHNSPYLVLHPH